MRVIGIDPGLRTLGWGVIEVDGPRLRHLANGTCCSTPSAALAARLLELHAQLAEVVARFAPQTAAVERTFVNKDAVATLKLGQRARHRAAGPGAERASMWANMPQRRSSSRWSASAGRPRNRSPSWCTCSCPAVTMRAGRRRCAGLSRSATRPPPATAGQLRGAGMIGKLDRDHRRTRRGSRADRCGGVGYIVHVSDHTRRPALGGERDRALHTELLVRDDLMQLYGFATLHEKAWHRLLIGAGRWRQGRAGHPRRAGARGDGARRRARRWQRAAQGAKGSGRNSAQRIANELAGQGARPWRPVRAAPAARRPAANRVQPPAPERPAAGARADAVSALQNLGYGPSRPPRRRGGAGRGRRESALIRRRHAGRRRADRVMTARTPPAPRRRRRGAGPGAAPAGLDEFIGQAEARANLKVLSRRPAGAARRWIIRCFSVRPGWARRRWRRSWRASWAWVSGHLRAGAGQGRRPCRDPDQPRGARRAVHRRDHRLNPPVEEVLYPAMEDFQLDLVIGEGPAARTVRIELQPFTLVGATTRLGLLTTPLRDRFGIPDRLEFYTVDELHRSSRATPGCWACPRGATACANRAPRPRHAAHRRVVDFALVEGDGRLTRELADNALTRLGVDGLGLDGADRRYLAQTGRELRRRPGGGGNHRRRAVGIARRDRGSDRALPAATRG